MTMTSNVIAVLGSAVIVAAFSGATAAARQQPAGQAPSSAPAPAGNAEKGKTLYMKYGCDQCHGNEGQGAPTSGPRIGPSPLPIAGFIRICRRPPNQMPPYSDKVVSDQDLRDMRAYLVTRARPTSTPLLQPEK